MIPIHEVMGPHFHKWHIAGVGVFHHILGADYGDFHDHPFTITSYIISGGYTEETPNGIQHRTPGNVYLIPATHIHRIIEVPPEGCWTFCTYGEWEQEVRFYRDGKSRLWHEPDFD